MRRLETKMEALGWVSHYRQVQQDRREQQAAQMAVAANRADAALEDARNERELASGQWLRVASEGQNLDPLLGRLWQAEIERCSAVVNDAKSARDKASEDLKHAIADFRSATVIADHSKQSFAAAKKQLARQADERRLAEISDLLAQRRSGR